MLSDEHRTAQSMAADAAAALRAGKSSKAAKLYRDAAEFERAALAKIPADANRTRGILAVSLVSMLYKAKQFDKAEVAAFLHLGQANLLGPAQSQLRELLEVIGDEKALLAKNMKYTGHQLGISLRGGLIGVGTAPLELFLDKVKGFHNLAMRVAEWVGKFELRRSGPPPSELAELMQARVTQPVSGSYRFMMKFTEPAQRTLFQMSNAEVEPAQVARTTFDLVKHAAAGEATKVAELVPDEPYREALLKLVRNIVPQGLSVREIELTQLEGNRVVSSFFMDKDAKYFVNESLKGVKTKQTTGFESFKIKGVLRGLHLDKRWLEVTIPGGAHERCQTKPDMLDDVVGPMVNKRVVVSCYKRKSGQLIFQDIELDE